MEKNYQKPSCFEDAAIMLASNAATLFQGIQAAHSNIEKLKGNLQEQMSSRTGPDLDGALVQEFYLASAGLIWFNDL